MYYLCMESLSRFTRTLFLPRSHGHGHLFFHAGSGSCCGILIACRGSSYMTRLDSTWAERRACVRACVCACFNLDPRSL